MKVVLFCGGLGTRLREFSDTIPKPMVPIGYRPILWHIMKYYAHFGHTEFVLALGYRGDMIKDYFLNYNECLSNDFVMTGGGKELHLLHSDIQDWKITFVETGLKSNIGQRLSAVRKYLGNDEWFLANYADGLSSLDLNRIISFAREKSAVATCLLVNPTQSFHVASVAPTGHITRIHPIADAGLMINGGFFVLHRDIFNYMQEGEELVNEPFGRLITEQKLAGYVYDGFWACMDTFKDKQTLDDMKQRGDTPWMLWEGAPRQGSIKRRDV